MRKRLLWASLLSAVFLVFLLIRVDWSHFVLITERVIVSDLFLAFGIFAMANFIRTLRFHTLDHMDKNLMHWWNLNAFYNFITATLPGGAGEAATVYALKRFSMFNILGAFRILLLSRLMDLFALSLLFFVSAILLNHTTPYREAAIWLSGSLFLMSLIALLPSSERYVLKLMQRMPGQGKLLGKVREKLSDLSKITGEQSNNNSFRVTLFQSLLMMIGGVAALHLVLRSFGIEFTPVQSAYCYGVYMVFQIVPIQGIAGIGTQAAWWALALNAAGYHSSETIALGFILHGTFYLFITSIWLPIVMVWIKQRKKPT